MGRSDTNGTAQYCYSNPNCGVYTFRSSRGGLTYVGMSSNIAARLRAHQRSGLLPRSNLSTVRTIPVNGGALQRRIREQYEIQSRGGVRNLANRINSIAPRLWHRYPSLQRWAIGGGSVRLGRGGARISLGRGSAVFR
ncbi:GIY-YIG nuclease family protein [Agrococcus lahaulensis]|nr:GIY-YIG nuclease family protein [Agrococcus lahaulensis]